jgi:hypothetical protein
MEQSVIKKMKWNEKNEIDFKDIYENKMTGSL